MSKVLIIVSGGNIQEVYCDTDDIQVTVIDHDNLSVAKHEDKLPFEDLKVIIEYPSNLTSTEQIEKIINNEMKQYE